METEICQRDNDLSKEQKMPPMGLQYVFLIGFCFRFQFHRTALLIICTIDKRYKFEITETKNILLRNMI